MAPKNKNKKKPAKIVVSNGEEVNVSQTGIDPLNSSRSKNSKTNGFEANEVEQSMEDSTLQFEESKREEDMNGDNDLNQSQGNLSSSQGGTSTFRDGEEESKVEMSGEKMILTELQNQIENEKELISPSKIKTK